SVFELTLPDEKLTLCAIASWLFHVTLVPAFTVSVRGPNLKFAIFTCAFATAAPLWARLAGFGFEDEELWACTGATAAEARVSRPGATPSASAVAATSITARMLPNATDLRARWIPRTSSMMILPRDQ